MDQVYKKLVEELNTYEGLNDIKEVSKTTFDKKVKVYINDNLCLIKKELFNKAIDLLLQEQKEICDDLIHTLNKMNKEK